MKNFLRTNSPAAAELLLKAAKGAAMILQAP